MDFIRKVSEYTIRIRVEAKALRSGERIFFSNYPSGDALLRSAACNSGTRPPIEINFPILSGHFYPSRYDFSNAFLLPQTTHMTPNGGRGVGCPGPRYKLEGTFRALHRPSRPYPPGFGLCHFLFCQSDPRRLFLRSL